VIGKPKIFLLFSLFFLTVIPYVGASPYITINSPENITYNVFNIPLNISVNETSNITIYVKSSDFDGNLTGYIINETDNSTIPVNYTVLNTDSYFNYLYVASGPVLLRVYVENENGSDVKEVWFTEFNHTEINVTTCGGLTASNHYYLMNDVSSSGTCFNIQTDNVYFDCMNHKISAYEGIYANYVNNIELWNCHIQASDTQFEFFHIKNLSIINITGDGDYSRIGQCENVSIINSTFYCTYSCLIISYVNNFTLSNSYVRDIHNYPLALDHTNHSLIINNRLVVVDSTPYGIYFTRDYSYYNNVTNNIIEGGRRSIVGFVYNSTFTDNILQKPIYFTGTYNFVYNNILPGSPHGNNYWNTTLRNGTNIVGGPYIGGNYWIGYSETCIDCDFDGICDEPYGGTVKDYLPLTNYTEPGGFIVTFNYTSVDFGNVSVNNIYEKYGYFVCGYSNSTFEVYINGTDFSSEWTIDNLNITIYNDSYSKTDTVSTVRRLFDTFVQGLFKHFYKFVLRVPLIPAGTYTSTITIDYVQV